MSARRLQSLPKSRYFQAHQTLLQQLGPPKLKTATGGRGAVLGARILYSIIPDQRVRSTHRSPLVVVCLSVLSLLFTVQCTTAVRATTGGDDTASLQAELDGLKPGDTLKLDRRTYIQDGVIEIRVPNTRIDGDGATIEARQDQTSAVRIRANGVSLSNLSLTAPLDGKRWYGMDQHKLTIEADNVSVRDVAIAGSAAVGLFVSAASNFTIDHVTVRHSRADGVHMTNGSNHGEVKNSRTEWTGDDGVAVVSYQNEPPCHDIVVDSPVVIGTNWGRGLSVVGGHDISYRKVTVSQTNAAGIYVADEGAPYYTHSASDVDITGGTVTNANTNANVAQGAVLLYSASTGKSLSRVTVSDLDISATSPSAKVNAAISVDEGTVSDIALGNFALRDTNLTPLYISAKVPDGSFTLWGWTKDGKPITVP